MDISAHETKQKQKATHLQRRAGRVCGRGQRLPLVSGLGSVTMSFTSASVLSAVLPGTGEAFLGSALTHNPYCDHVVLDATSHKVNKREGKEGSSPPSLATPVDKGPTPANLQVP